MDEVRHTLTGNFQKFEDFQSRHLPDARTILVYLPPDYETNPTGRYPVLYLQDGQNLFDGVTSYTGQEWMVDETAEELILAGRIEPIIIVGIYNAGEHRIDEYTPTIDPDRLRGGQSDLYFEMLTLEIMPWVNASFRTLTGGENTGLGGSSLGGLLTLTLGLKAPDAFGKLAVLSPSLWWDHELLLHRAEALPDRLPLKIWLDMGTEEGEDGVRNVQLLHKVLVEKGWKDDVDLRVYEARGAGHNESAWAARMAQVLEFLFPARSELAGLSGQPGVENR